MSFSSFGFCPEIEKGIQSLGYAAPTPIQTQAIPEIFQGRDLIGLAQTGTGKTAAFVLPILQRLMPGPRKHIRALIVSPTRELAAQTHEFILGLARHAKIKAVAIYGGVGKAPQIAKIKKGVEIMTACPGRLIDLMDQGVFDLSQLEVLVIDEADRMFDMGFLPDIRTIIGRIPTGTQTLLFSATMPDDIKRLADDILVNPVTVTAGEMAPVSTVSHSIYPVQPHLKAKLLMKLLDSIDTGSVLVFTRTKERTSRLAAQMKKAGYEVVALHGDLPQGKRRAAMDGFRAGKYRILVATDIAARGIDISLISHVINYDMPDTVDAYTHRIGRTGRAARTGDAFSFVTIEDRGFVWEIERVLGEKLDSRILQDFDYTVPAPSGHSEAARDSASGSRRSGGAAPSRTRRSLSDAFPGLGVSGGASRPFSNVASLRPRRPRTVR